MILENPLTTTRMRVWCCRDLPDRMPPAGGCPINSMLWVATFRILSWTVDEPDRRRIEMLRIPRGLPMRTMMALQYSNRPHRSRLLSRSRRNLLTRLHADANKSRVSIGADYQASDDQRGDGGSSPAAPEGQRDARPAGNEGRVEFWKSPRPRTSSTPEGSISTTARSSPAERADTTASKASLDGLPTNEASKPAPMTLSYRVGHQQVAAGDRAVRDRSEKAKKKKTSEALQEEGGSRSAEPAKGDGKPKNSKQQARRGGTK